MPWIPKHLRPPPPPKIDYYHARPYHVTYILEGVTLHATIRAQSAEAVKARLMRHLGQVEIVNISVG